MVRSGLWWFIACGLAALVSACASGGAFPPATEPMPHVVGRAMAAITEAAAAGADSLAPEPIKAARQHLVQATAEEQAKHTDRAALLARETIADASYARAEAERVAADHARTAAATQLDKLTSGEESGSARP